MTNKEFLDWLSANGFGIFLFCSFIGLPLLGMLLNFLRNIIRPAPPATVVQCPRHPPTESSADDEEEDDDEDEDEEEDDA